MKAQYIYILLLALPFISCKNEVKKTDNAQGENSEVEFKQDSILNIAEVSDTTTLEFTPATVDLPESLQSKKWITVHKYQDKFWGRVTKDRFESPEAETFTNKLMYDFMEPQVFQIQRVDSLSPGKHEIITTDLGFKIECISENPQIIRWDITTADGSPLALDEGNGVYMVEYESGLKATNLKPLPEILSLNFASQFREKGKPNFSEPELHKRLTVRDMDDVIDFKYEVNNFNTFVNKHKLDFDGDGIEDRLVIMNGMIDLELYGLIFMYAKGNRDGSFTVLHERTINFDDGAKVIFSKAKGNKVLYTCKLGEDTYTYYFQYEVAVEDWLLKKVDRNIGSKKTSFETINRSIKTEPENLKPSEDKWEANS